MAKILIVDDSPTEAHILEGILTTDGHEVIKAENGTIGLATAIEELPDLILMDVLMPGMNGFQTTRKLHRDARTKQIPIIIVTTKNEDTDIEWGLSQGASDYMVKPVDVSLFREKVKTLLGSSGS